MSKDFILAKTKDMVPKSRGSLNIEDETFENIQNQLNNISKNHPLLWKLFRDQYSNEKILLKDLVKLTKEVSQFLKSKKSLDLKSIRNLKKLNNICKIGTSKKLNLYGAGD